ncbi:MAG: proline--tRNA ligase [Anaerolineae bacterium]
MAQQAVTPQSVDFSKWYNEIVYKADLCDLSPVRGCLIIKPYGYELWEAVKGGLDRRFKATGHQNAYFPLFIPESFLKREAEHVEGFSPELAVVTIAGGEKLEEPLVVRPTSETIIMDSFKNWIQSYRDLPLLINQWANVVRWEMRTRPFLRTTEFLWQEGHTAHATAEEAEAETMQMLNVYADFAINDAAIPVVKGRKTEREKFAGAVHTYTIEAMMGDTKALQSGTSHNLGQNFAKAFDIKFLDQNNETQHPWTTSWGLSTRMVGAIVMAHGDDKGLRLPPKVAPIQVVIVPIFKNDDERSKVLEAVERLTKELLAANIRIHVDKREGQSPGFKFNDWEMRGVPARLEIGPKDVQNSTVALARRDVPGKEGKQFVSQDGIAARVQDLLTEIQANMLQQATVFRDANIHDATNYDELKAIVEKGGWARVWWAGSGQDEGKIKEETGATIRCLPFDQPGSKGKCVYTGQSAETIALFGKAY